jgi:beta-galactosidase/beta-glucuronidase
LSWQPVRGNILTRWAENVIPENVWQEYPRPQMARPEWMNLNGLWEYSIVDQPNQLKSPALGQILVPFPIESALSGVKRPLLPSEYLVYRRYFDIPTNWSGKRILLHFGAVDWQAIVYLNSQQVGAHTGGYLPFDYDITSYLSSDASSNELEVVVWDPTDAYWQQRGKQVLQPRSIWYSAVSGIWQTVWLEPVPQTYISVLKITPDLNQNAVRVKVLLEGSPPGFTPLHLTISGASVSPVQAESTDPDAEITIPLDNPHLWSPSAPFLYDLDVRFGDDRVTSYFGMRKFSLENNRLCLNNQPFFQLGPLDQGYWPDGLYTPPSDAAMLSDLELIKGLGFNMLRKHVKVEPARYYYHCDRLGLIVWQDMPNGGKAVGDFTSVFTMIFGSRRKDQDYRYAGRELPASRDDFHRELQELVDNLYNFTCIGLWVPFNEGWGQFDANEIAEWLSNYDPSRPVDHASGWFDQGGGDCQSLHIYKLKLPAIKSDSKRATVLSEFGGYSLNLDGHLWNPGEQFGHKTFKSSQALTEAYVELLSRQLKPGIEAGLSAAIYTQTSDVEIETNGFVTYDRAVEKMDFRLIRQAHDKLFSGYENG